MKVLTNKEKVMADDYTINKMKVPSIILMENAAQSVYRVIKKNINKKDKILVLTGKGNNGGDGFALARILKINSYKVDILKIYEPKTEDAIENESLAQKYSVPIKDKFDFDEYNVFVDAVFGTGFKGKLEERIQTIFEKINNQNSLNISIDIPSGVSGNNQDISKNCFNADITVTFEYPVLAHCLYPGKKYTKKLVVKPIGLKSNKNFKTELLEKEELYLKPPKFDVHKYSRGQVSVISGIKKYSGASYLTAKSALKSTAGYVRLIGENENRFNDKLPEIVISRVNSFSEWELTDKIKEGVIAAGPGLGRNKERKNFLQKLFNNYEGLNLVLDADALYYFKDYYKKSRHNVIITPHIKEFSRIINTSVEKIKRNLLYYGKNFANEYSLTLILKSENTVIFSKDKRAVIIPFGNQYLATLGSGDVLTGIVAGLWSSQNFNSFEIAKKAAGIHGLIADYLVENKIFNFTSSDIIDNIKNVLRRIIKTSGRLSNDSKR